MSQGSFNRDKTHCIRGHNLSDDNLYVTPSTGQRQCKFCRDKGKQLWQLNKRYGMTALTDRDDILTSQGGCCKLCKRTDCTWKKGILNAWHIDHIHGTKIVRGILCGNCNLLVGAVEKNLPLTFEAIKYLQGDS